MLINPVKVLETNDWKNELIIAKKLLGIEKPIVLTCNSVLKLFNLYSIFESESIFSNIKSDPTFESCKLAVDFGNNRIFDGVIAIGGGSVMDTAKVVMSSLGTGITDISKLIEFKESFKKTIPSIFLPTTHGTASEVTMWGTVWDMKNKKKCSISHLDLFPTIAILDGSLTQTLPITISIFTALDALSHSFEAIWNKNANKDSTIFAINAISIILKNINLVKTNPLDLKVRNNLLKASNIAGLAFSRTKTAAAHSISYPLTINYKIPHGIASSMPLLPLLKINEDAIANEIEEIKKILNYNSTFELENNIKNISGNTIKYRLRDWGVKRNDIPLLIEQSFTKDRMENNIVDLTKSDVEDILLKIF